MDSSPKARIDWRVFLAFAFFSLAVPIPWLIAGIFAAAFHELGHIGVLLLCGVKCQEIQIGINGAKITAPPMEPGKELCCILAGPAASLLLMSLHQTFPRIAICGFVQGVFNLLPVGTLDGNNALRICRDSIFSKK